MMIQPTTMLPSVGSHSLSELWPRGGLTLNDDIIQFYAQMSECFASAGTRELEIAANRFAGALLMPRKALEASVEYQPVGPLDEMTFRRLSTHCEAVSRRSDSVFRT